MRDSRRTVEELADMYLARCEQLGRAPKTIVKYRGQLERLKKGCQARNIRRAKKFSPDNLFAYRIFSARECRLSEKNIYNETIVIKQLFKWAAKNGHISRNLLAPVCFEKVKSPKQPCFTMDQVELLLANADLWAVPMFTTLAFTGMRIAELRQLTWGDVDLDRDVIQVHCGGSGSKPKDKEDGFIPIHRRKLRPVLQSLPRRYNLVFPMPGVSP